eukprot:5435932-Pyramimonas_sp.AAC.1
MVLFIVRRARRHHIGAAADEFQTAVGYRTECKRMRASWAHAPEPAQEVWPDMAALQAHRKTFQPM